MSLFSSVTNTGRKDKAKHASGSMSGGMHEELDHESNCTVHPTEFYTWSEAKLEST
jgi:hypothetical protein